VFPDAHARAGGVRAGGVRAGGVQSIRTHSMKVFLSFPAQRRQERAIEWWQID